MRLSPAARTLTFSAAPFDQNRPLKPCQRYHGAMSTLLWLLAVVLVVVGIVYVVRGAVLVGIVLIVLGLLVGPGGVSIFT